MKRIIAILCIASLALVGCTSKPSKETVRTSFRKNLIESLGADAPASQKAAIKSYANCIVDATFDKISAKTLRKFVDAKNADDFTNVNGTKDEKDALDSAAETCSNKLIEEANS